MTEYFQSPGLPRGFALTGRFDRPVLLRPTGLIAGAAGDGAVAAGLGLRLRAGALVFTACEAFLQGDGQVCMATASLPPLQAWAEAEGERTAELVAGALAALSAALPAYAGLALGAPRLAGILNLTPDSFHDGGAHDDRGAAIAHGEALLAAGAHIIDVGGQSTRPGAAPVSEAEELARVVPVVRALAGGGALVSVDTSRAGVMAAALDCGAAMVNDVTALTFDAAALALVAEREVPVVLMHMQGTPATMQDAPSYGHAAYEVYRYLEERIVACEDAGIPRTRIAVDPGFGFGKTLAHNMQVLDHAALFHGLGCAVMAGLSRKSFINDIVPGTPSAERLPGTLAAVVMAADQGVQLHRVHDVAEARQALQVWRAVRIKRL